MLALNADPLLYFGVRHTPTFCQGIHRFFFESRNMLYEWLHLQNIRTYNEVKLPLTSSAALSYFWCFCWADILAMISPFWATYVWALEFIMRLSTNAALLAAQVPFTAKSAYRVGVLFSDFASSKFILCQFYSKLNLQ